jgi:MATE family multidrug resistance protein
LLFFPTYYLVFPLWGNHGLWLAFVLFMLTRGIVQTVLAPYAVLKKL